MSDEEKKAIESFKEENNKDLSRFDDFNSYTQFKVKRDKLIIDLIEKQQKEIEDRKVQIEYNNVFNKGVKSVEDKIKAKIEELDDLNSPFAQRVIKGKEVYLTEMVQNILQSLLKKE